MAFDVKKRFEQHEAMLVELREKTKDRPEANREAVEAAAVARSQAVDDVWNTLEATVRNAPLQERAELSRVLMCQALNQAAPELRKDLLDLKMLEDLHEVLPKKEGQLFHGFDNTIGRTRVLKNTLTSHADHIAQWGPEAETLLVEFTKEKSLIAPHAVRESRNQGGSPTR